MTNSEMQIHPHSPLTEHFGANALTGLWQSHLGNELKAPYMLDLAAFLRAEIAVGKTVYPPQQDWFRAFSTTPFDQVKVVIIGQDPYHGPGQAHGLCFSVLPGVRPPPSLVNIFKEMKTDLGLERADHGFLMSWAEQGVLLLNSVLTVEEGRPASHQGRGWETFTDRAIHLLNDNCEGLVFLLWGAYAQKKAQFVDRTKHVVIEGRHPSPLSASRGFFGSRPFSQINRALLTGGREPIRWQLPRREELP